MKQLLATLIFSAIFVVSAFAVINAPVVTALNTSTYTAVTIPRTNGSCRAVTVYTEDSSSFYIASDSTGTGEALVPANTSLSYNCVTDTAGVVLYAKSSSGTPNLVAIVGEK